LCPALLDADLRTGSVHELLVGMSTLPLLRSEFEVEAQALAAGELPCCRLRRARRPS